jgi:hypothetical protein
LSYARAAALPPRCSVPFPCRSGSPATSSAPMWPAGGGLTCPVRSLWRGPHRVGFGWPNGMWRSLVSAPALGAGGRRFESGHPDHKRSSGACRRLAGRLSRSSAHGTGRRASFDRRLEHLLAVLVGTGRLLPACRTGAQAVRVEQDRGWQQRRRVRRVASGLLSRLPLHEGPAAVDADDEAAFPEYCAALAVVRVSRRGGGLRLGARPWLLRDRRARCARRARRWSP